MRGVEQGTSILSETNRHYSPRGEGKREVPNLGRYLCNQPGLHA
jgi:hypothetical protein